MTEQERLDQEWNDWREATPEYLETESNNAKLTEELRALATAGHPLNRATVEIAVKNLTARGELSMLAKGFVRKAAPTAEPEPVFESKRFDDLSSGTARHDGHISVLQLRKWQEEEEANRQAENLQRQLRDSQERDARNQPEQPEIQGELPLSLMDNSAEEIRVLSLPSVSPAKIRNYMQRKNEETMRRMQEAVRRR